MSALAESGRSFNLVAAASSGHERSFVVAPSGAVARALKQQAGQGLPDFCADNA
jgi:hypothetical protein